MSIREMIAEHPDVAGHANDYLGNAVRHAMYCAAICNSCADACMAEKNATERAQCIRLCNDCSDICTTTYREMHDDAHCRRCAKMCRECAQDCRTARDNL